MEEEGRGGPYSRVGRLTWKKNKWKIKLSLLRTNRDLQNNGRLWLACWWYCFAGFINERGQDVLVFFGAVTMNFFWQDYREKKKGCWTEVINRHSTKKWQNCSQKATDSFPLYVTETRCCETGLKKKYLIFYCSPQQGQARYSNIIRNVWILLNGNPIIWHFSDHASWINYILITKLMH